MERQPHCPWVRDNGDNGHSGSYVERNPINNKSFNNNISNSLILAQAQLKLHYLLKANDLPWEVGFWNKLNGLTVKTIKSAKTVKNENTALKLLKAL